MATIAMLQAPFRSHLALPSRVALALADAGHRLIVWGPPHEARRQRELLGAGRCELRDDHFSAAVWERLRELNQPPGSPGAAAALADALERATVAGLPGLLDEFAQERVSALVYDSMAVWGPVAAGLLKLPRVASVVAHTVEPAGSSIGGLTGASPSSATAQLAALARLAGQPDRRGAAFGDRTLLYTCPELAGRAVDHPSCRFVGPLPEFAPPVRPAAPPPRRPRVLVALGTLVTRQFDLYATILRALGEQPLELVLATGAGVDGDALRAIAPSAEIREQVDQPALLRDCALFITHAGLNSVLEALLEGVPMLCCPIAGDQREGARQVAAAGAGAILEPDADVARIAEVASRLLDDPSARRAAGALGAALRRTGGAKLAVSSVEELL